MWWVYIFQLPFCNTSYKTTFELTDPPARSFHHLDPPVVSPKVRFLSFRGRVNRHTGVPWIVIQPLAVIKLQIWVYVGTSATIHPNPIYFHSSLCAHPWQSQQPCWLTGLDKWFERWVGGTRPWGPRGKGSPSVSKGPKPPIQLLQLLKNSPREEKRAHFVIY